MLGNFIYSDDVSAAYEETAGYSYDTPRKVENNVKRFLLLAVIFLCGGLIWIFCISPCMAPVKVDVKGFPGFEKAEALQYAGIAPGATFISVNAGELEARLAGHYLVESAKVVKRFPDRLSVFLEPRRAVAMALAKVNGRTRPVYLDRFGVLFRASGEEGPLSSMPVLSGVFGADQQLWLGTRLSAPFLPLMERIGSISDEDPKIWQTISEISIAEKSGDLYDLVLYPVDNSIRLRMGGDISKEGIYYALLMLDVCRQFGDSAPEEIDVRSGLGVYKVKESRFGE